MQLAVGECGVGSEIERMMDTQSDEMPAALADDALASAARRDPDAFAELYRRYVDRVFRYLLARLGDSQLAQDLTAQTFLAALEGIDGYAGRGDLAAWLVAIARHKVLDHFRRSRPSLPLDQAQSLPDPRPGPDDLAADRLRLEQVARVLQTLPSERAEAFALRMFSDLSVAEVGRVMGKSEAAVKMLVHRAVRDLRERLILTGEADL